MGEYIGLLISYEAVELTISSGSPDLDRQNLYTGRDGVLQIGHDSTNGLPRATFSIHAESSTTTIQSDSGDGGKDKQFLILQGPSGKGEHQLKQASTTDVEGIGSNIMFDEWLLVEDGNMKLLRYSDPSLAGHWVASHDEHDQSWSVWWYTPSAANMEDLLPYLSVDIELAEVSKGNNGDERAEL